MDLIPKIQVLSELGISRQTLWRWHTKGLRFFKVGSKLFYRRSDLDLFIGKHSSHFPSQINKMADGKKQF